MTKKWILRCCATIAAVFALVVAASAGVAGAATPPIGSYPTYTTTSPGHFDGTFPAAAAFPNVHVVTDNTGASVSSGRTAFLGASTGFGQTFGSSRLQPYITIASLGQVNPSTTTITFDSTTPVGWGFALGDIDADYASIVATGPGGVLTSAQLGAQNTNNNPYLNYCLNASPKPGTCTRPPFTAFPSWCPTGAFGAPCTGKPANSVVGNGVDSDGSYDWFIPSVGITSMTLTFHPLSGLPNFQLWMVAPTPATTVTGTVAVPGEPTPPAGTSVALLDAAGTPVPDIQGDPVTSPVAPNGSFSLDTANGNYELGVIVPAGFTAPPPVPFSATGAPLDLGTLSVTAVPPVVTPPPTGAVPDPQLAATGADLAPGLSAGLLVVALGAVLFFASRRRRV